MQGLALHDVRSSEVTKRREENVRALEQKQQQIDLESYRRSEAIEAARREQMRKQRNAERLLIEAHEAAEREEQQRLRLENEARERQRVQQLEAEKQRIELARADEQERQLVRQRQLQSAEKAAAQAKEDEARRQRQHLEMTAGARMVRSFDRILQRLGDTISADNKMMEHDAASRRRERQLASDAHLALGRVKALERTLSAQRERERAETQEMRRRQEAEDTEARFHLRELNAEQARALLLAPKASGGVSGGSKTAAAVDLDRDKQQHHHHHHHHNNDDDADRKKNDDDDDFDSDDGDDNNYAALDGYDDTINDGSTNAIAEVSNTALSAAARQRKRKNRRAQRLAAEEQAILAAQQAPVFQDSFQDEQSATRKRRTLQPLDYSAWAKQRESEAELVSLSLEYKMRAAAGGSRQEAQKN